MTYTNLRKENLAKQTNNWVLVGVACVVALIAVTGCDSGGGSMTKAEEDAARHPVANPGNKGPTDVDRQKMTKSIEAFQQKHANDKVEFNAPK